MFNINLFEYKGVRCRKALIVCKTNLENLNEFKKNIEVSLENSIHTFNNNHFCFGSTFN